jgi:hypothetical protein
MDKTKVKINLLRKRRVRNKKLSKTIYIMTSSIPFWSNDPTILMNKEYIKELYPMPNMTYEQKLNAITRLVILLIVIGFIFTASLKLLFMGIITVVVIFILFKTQKQKVTKESFLNGISGSDGISASKGNGTS